MHPLRVATLLLMAAVLPPARVRAQAPVAAFEGRPFFSEGADLGYYLWKDGDTWKLRWTTRGALRHFAGSVTAEGGKLKSLKRIDVEKERKALFPGRVPHPVAGARGNVRTKGGRPPVVVDRDKIDRDGDNRIVFSTRTNDDIDGFDFKTDKQVTDLRFLLEIDGKEYPRLVEFGRGNQKASNIPLAVRVQ